MSNAKKPILSSDITIHDSELLVADLDAMRDFYTTSVGLEVLETAKSSVLLGHGEKGMIRLVSRPKLPFAAQSEAGLFHNAILFESRASLAMTLQRMIQMNASLYTGSGDHLVSEAFYFNDPEGNGVEIYYDRPRDTWEWTDGMVKMDTLYIDPMKYIQDYREQTQNTDKYIGHIHLKVGDISKARQFYVNILGFAITANFPGALFVAVGGYHHRIGMNTWLSEGAGPRQKTLGYSNATITLQSNDDLDALAGRLKVADRDFSYNNGVLKVSDPWKNDFTFTAL